ncbi:MAG: hypothetical protein U9N62_05325 [Thermotogota bacterium]|nr:hypothetical protein [Thermotogota bacterium]
MKKSSIFVMIFLFISILSFAQQDALDNHYLSFGEEEFISVSPSESVSVNHNIPEEILEKNPSIGFFDSELTFDINNILKSSMIFDSSGNTLFYVPMEEGKYNVCVFVENEMISDLITFEVAIQELHTKVTLDKDQVSVGELVSVSFEDAPGNEYDWIGVYEPDADHFDFYTYEYLYGAKEGTIELYMPEESGKFQLRMFEDDSYNLIAQSENYDVIASTQEETDESNDLSQYNTTLEIETDAAFRDELITVSYYNAPGNETDWIGIYEVGDTEGYIIDWLYTDGSENGLVDFYAPYEPGNYLFRFFPNDTFDIIAESDPFAVLDVETTNPEDSYERVMVRESIFCETVEEDLSVNEKTDFTYSDDYCYLWLELGSFKGSHEGIWEWYYPDGELYDTVYLDIPSAYERGLESFDSLSLWSWIPIKDEPEKQAGIWKVHFYIDDELVLARQFKISDSQSSKRPVIETTEKTIQIGELSLTVPVNAEWFEDTEYEDSYYINLEPERDFGPLVGIDFSTEELLYEEGEAYIYQSDDLQFEGWDYISYDEEYELTDRIIDLKITNQYDSYGNMIYIFFVCSEDEYEDWEDEFINILDSVRITE